MASIWASIGKTFQQCRLRLANAPDCEVSVEILKRDPGKSRFISPALRELEMRCRVGQASSRTQTGKMPVPHQAMNFVSSLAPVPRPKPLLPRARF